MIQLPTTNEVIDLIHRNNSITTTHPLNNNEYIILKNGKKSALAQHKNGVLHKIDTLSFNKVTPKDASQTAFFHSLEYPNTILTIGIGRAGSGKTLLTLAWAMHHIYVGTYDRIIFTKPNTVVGSTFGFGAVPGDLDEKFEPFLMSYADTFRTLLGDTAYLHQMIKKKKIEYRPVQYLRGANLENAILVVDEVQNLSWHELKTILTRLSGNGKAIVIGDLKQIDTKQKEEETGVYKLIHSQAFKNSTIGSSIFFTKQYRTAINDLIEEVESELI